MTSTLRPIGKLTGAIVACIAVLLAGMICVGQAYAADSAASGASSALGAANGQDIQSTTLGTQASEPTISYNVMYKKKWEGWKKNGSTAGTSTSKRFNGIAAKIVGASGTVKYHVKPVNGNWSKAQKKGKAAGSANWDGIECFTMTLTGKVANKYDVYYRANMEGTGWQTWRMNGQIAGTPGKESRVISMEVKLVKKDAKSFIAGSQKVEIVNFYDQGGPDANYKAFYNYLASKKPMIINIKQNLKVAHALKLKGSNKVVNATGKKITIVDNGSGLFTNDSTKANYYNLNSITIRGGEWRNAKIGVEDHSMIRLSFASNIEIIDFSIKDGYQQHAIELIACKDVDIYRVKLQAQGKCGDDWTHDQLQIDLADHVAAPSVPEKLCNGTPSKNIFVNECVISGARGIGCNWAYADPSHCTARCYHSNIVIKNCKIAGLTAEALSVFNTTSARIEGNTIITYAPTDRDSYSIGCHVAYMYDATGPSPSTSNEILVANNTIKGGRQAFFLYTHNDALLGRVVVIGNHAYCRNGAGEAIAAWEDQALEVVEYGNDTHDW